MAKLGAALLCLVFALAFGAVGVGASWVLYRMVHDGHRAEEWVGVKAEVDEFHRGSVKYRYNFRGVDYSGDRLGTNPIGGTDDIDSWQDDMFAMFSTAKMRGEPVMVWVNPDNPSESMVDRTIRWKLAMFALPFALGFGGVGVGALFMFFRTLLRSGADVAAQPDPVASFNPKPGSGVISTWIFAFFWNVISFPIALVLVPGSLADGQWAVLFVLIFPLIGLLLLWGAISTTVQAIRARFASAPELPRLLVPRHAADDGGFARGMISDEPTLAAQGGGASPVIDANDDGMPDATTFAFEKLAGEKLDDTQRASLRQVTDKLSAQQKDALLKGAKWIPKLKYLVFAIVGIVVFFDYIWPVIRYFIK